MAYIFCIHNNTPRMSWRLFIGRNVRSVKILACPTSPTSAVARTFWDKNYPLVKHLNPSFPFSLRAAPNTSPYMMVEYDYAYKVQVPLGGLEEADIEKKLEEAVKIGENMPRSIHQSGPVLQPSVVE